MLGLIALAISGMALARCRRTALRRAIDLHEGEDVDESAFSALVRQAVAVNSSGKSKSSKEVKPAAAKSKGGDDDPALLSRCPRRA